MQPFVLHTHFYQPERANPWTQALDPEQGAAPFRDWNERIHEESYRANAFARIYDAEGRVERIVNTYEHVSFNFGPTLLAWMERTHPATYARVLEADRRSLVRTGHGNALAQAFHHTILPLDTERNRRTQVRWGVLDFRHRFGREPEGMWLPEAAVSQPVVDTLIDEGIVFTVLAPRQVGRVREIGGQWRALDGDPDTTRPYLIRHSDGSGRRLGVFLYDGDLAQRFAFDPETMDSGVMVDALCTAASSGLVHAAMDGETFGHHHRFGELGLAYTLAEAGPRRGLEPTNYGSYLAACPPTDEVELVEGEGSSWSCAHGVGRWVRDCGCSTDAQPGWDQEWRGPLREALDLVAELTDTAFQERGRKLLVDPWGARDAYVEVLVGAVPPAQFLADHARGELSTREESEVWSLLEAQRNAMAMYTSCGWFFADVSGIETVYVMRFAARACDLLAGLGVDAPREAVLARLSDARSNRPEIGSGADVWRDQVEPYAVSPERIAAQTALCAVAGLDPMTGAEGHDVVLTDSRRLELAGTTLTAATVHVTPRATGRTEAFTVAGCGLHDLDLHARAVRGTSPSPDELLATLRQTSPHTLLTELDLRLGGHAYTLDDALPSGRMEIVALARERIARSLRQDLGEVADRYEGPLEALHAAGAPLAPEARMIRQARLAGGVEEAIALLRTAPEAVLDRLPALREARDVGHPSDFERLRKALSEAIAEATAEATTSHSDRTVERVERLAAVTGDLGCGVDLSRAQEQAYAFAIRARDEELSHCATAARLGEALGLAPSCWGGS